MRDWTFEQWIDFGTLVTLALGFVGLFFAGRQSADSRAARKRAELDRESAIIRVHRVKDAGGESLMVMNLGQWDCADVAIHLTGIIGDRAYVELGGSPGKRDVSGLAVAAGSWILVKLVVAQVDVLAAKVEVRWSDGRGPWSAVQTLGSALTVESVPPDWWAQVRRSGI